MSHLQQVGGLIAVPKVVRWLLALVLLAAPQARAQVVLHPNQIVGDVTFTNVNPEIVAVLQRPLRSSSIGAANTRLSLQSYGNATGSTLASASYQVTVDTTDEGLEYDVQAGLRTDGLTYATSVHRSAVVQPEPTPDVRLDIAGCAAMVRVQFADASGTPVTVTNISLRIPGGPGWGSVSGYGYDRGSASSLAASSLDVLAEADGLSHVMEIAFDTGSDPFHDTIRWVMSADVTLACDDIVIVPVEVIYDLNPDTGLPLPRIVGMLDIHGRDEARMPTNLTGLMGYGPWGNSRRDFIDRTPSSGAFELENLVPSAMTLPATPWSVGTNSCFGADRDATSFAMSGSALVPDTGTLDFGDAFVVDPGIVRTDIRVAGPPDAGDRILADVRLINDSDGDGVHDGPCAAPTYVHGSSAGSAVPPGLRTWSASASVGLDMEYDPAAQELLGVGRLTVGGPARTATPWSVCDLYLSYLDEATPSNPISWRRGYTSLYFDTLPALTVPAGATQAESMRACMSELYLTVLSDGVPFERPSMSVAGGRFSGVDFEGRTNSYRVNASAEGMPRDSASASTEGLIVALLPEGDWQLSVHVVAHDPGGTTSNTELVNFPLHVGCGQIINLTSQLQLAVNKLAPCTGPGLVHVTGNVTSTRPILRIAWSLDGGPWTDACTNCGVSPTYEFDVLVPSADSRLVVKAWDEAGLQASVVAFTGLTGEPSAVDLQPSAPPLRVSKLGGGLHLTWEPRPVDTYTVHQGTIAAFRTAPHYDHGAVVATCRQNGNRADLPMPVSGAYFIVTEACDFGNGSFGRDSFRRERPQTATGCP